MCAGVESGLPGEFTIVVKFEPGRSEFAAHSLSCYAATPALRTGWDDD